MIENNGMCHINWAKSNILIILMHAILYGIWCIDHSFFLINHIFFQNIIFIKISNDVHSPDLPVADQILSHGICNTDVSYSKPSKYLFHPAQIKIIVGSNLPWTPWRSSLCYSINQFYIFLKNRIYVTEYWH